MVLTLLSIDVPREKIVRGERVAEAIRAGSKPFVTTQDIADELDCSPQAVRNNEKELSNDNRLRKGKVGRSTVYWLADKETPEPVTTAGGGYPGAEVEEEPEEAENTAPEGNLSTESEGEESETVTLGLSRSDVERIASPWTFLPAALLVVVGITAYTLAPLYVGFTVELLQILGLVAILSGQLALTLSTLAARALAVPLSELLLGDISHLWRAKA